MILDLFKLDGQVALVTGAGRGMGQALALALAEAGADVAGLGTGRLDDTAARVRALGRRFLPLKVDLLSAHAADLAAVVADVEAGLGPLDILVNNAGIIRRGGVLETSEQDWDDVMQVNLKAVFLLSQAAGRGMAARGHGKIINIASVLSFQGGIRVPAYTAAKSGLAGLTRLMANELAAKGVNVNAIAPGYIATDATAVLLADAERSAAIVARIPAGHWGQAADLMGTVVYMASAASNYMHGAVVPVDGGWLAR